MDLHTGLYPKRGDLQQSQHNSILEKAANNYLGNGYYVWADHIPWIYGSPQGLPGRNPRRTFIPDIIAAGPDSFVIVEVETADSISYRHTIDQICAFNDAAARVQNGAFILLLPKFLGMNAHLPKAIELKNRYNLSHTSIISQHVKTGQYENIA